MTVLNLSSEYSTVAIMFVFVVIIFYLLQNRYILLEGGEGNPETNCYHSYRRYLRHHNHTDDEIKLLTADTFYPTIFTKCAKRSKRSLQNKYKNISYKNLNVVDKGKFQTQFSHKYDAFAAAVEHGKNTDQSCTTYREKLNKLKPNIATRITNVCNYLDKKLPNNN
jgi:hypothetical protein